jgi:hypothetical protein
MRRGLMSGAAMAGGLVLVWMNGPVTTQPAAAQGAGAPAFLQPGRCYRFTFPITGAPNWKVLEVQEAGWIRAEVDAGPANARREAAWVNTAQIITARGAPCSE